MCAVCDVSIQGHADYWEERLIYYLFESQFPNVFVYCIAFLYVSDDCEINIV